MGGQRVRFELGVELYGKKPGMRRYLYNLDEFGVRRTTGDAQPGLGQELLVLSIELESMPMPFHDVQGSVCTMCE